MVPNRKTRANKCERCSGIVIGFKLSKTPRHSSEPLAFSTLVLVHNQSRDEAEVVPHVSSPRFAVPPHRAVHLVKVGIVHMHVTDEIPLPRLLPHDVGYYPIVLEILDSSNCGARHLPQPMKKNHVRIIVERERIQVSARTNVYFREMSSSQSPGHK